MFIWMFVRVYECVCVHMFVVLGFFYFVLFKKKKKSGHLMSLAITDDFSEPVCLSQDCLPARMKIIPLTSEFQGYQWSHR